MSQISCRATQNIIIIDDDVSGLTLTRETWPRIVYKHIQNGLFQAEGEATMKLFLNKNFMNWHTTKFGQH